MPQPSMDELLPIIGTSGLKRSGGIVYEEIMTKLQGIRGVRFFREMVDNCPPAGALRFMIHSLVRQVPWFIEAASEDNAAELEREKIEETVTDMESSIEDVMTEILSMIEYGWAYMEILYKIRRGPDHQDPTLQSDYSDGRWGWRSLALRGQDTLDKWEFDEATGSILGLWQQDTSAMWHGNVYIPMEKAVLFRTEATKNNPEGRSLYRSAALAWHFLKRIQEIEAIGVERDMHGIIDMQVPMEFLATNASAGYTAFRSSLETQLGQLKRDERAYVLRPSELDTDGKPTGFKLGLLHAGGGGRIDTTSILNRYESHILKVGLGQFLRLGEGARGSNAMSESHQEIFQTALEAIVDMVAVTFTKHAIHKLEDLNGTRRELWPKLSHGKVHAPSLDDVSRLLVALSGGGVDISAPSVLRYVFDKGGIPLSAVDELEAADATNSDIIKSLSHGCGC